MAQDNAYKLALKLKNYNSEKPKLMKAIGIAARDHFKLNFKKEGFADGGVKKWSKRKFEFPGKQRAVLTGRGNLRDSISYNANFKQVTISNNKKYAKLHNEGGEITVTPKMRSFFWAMYYEATGRKKADEAQIWKNLALKKGNTMKVEKRQFMGHSKELTRKIDKMIKELIKRI